MKKEKWIKPTIIIVVVLALLISAGIWFYDLAFGGTLKLTVTDVTDALNACKVPLIIAGVLTIIAVILALISFKLKKPLKKFGESTVSCRITFGSYGCNKWIL